MIFDDEKGEVKYISDALDPDDFDYHVSVIDGEKVYFKDTTFKCMYTERDQDEEEEYDGSDGGLWGTPYEYMR